MTTTTMKRLLWIAVLCLLVPCSVSSLIIPKASASATKASKILPPLRGGATGTTSTDDDNVAVQDFRPQAIANIRIPAALFAGAFAMPSIGMSDSLKLVLVKRLYSLLLLGSLSSQIVAVVVSTLTVGALAADSDDQVRVGVVAHTVRFGMGVGPSPLFYGYHLVSHRHWIAGLGDNWVPRHRQGGLGHHSIRRSVVHCVYSRSRNERVVVVVGFSFEWGRPIALSLPEAPDWTSFPEATVCGSSGLVDHHVWLYSLQDATYCKVAIQQLVP
jgi:hypothetical protein